MTGHRSLILAASTALLLFGLSTGCVKDQTRPQFPCSLGPLEWHIDERALKAIRPNVWFSSSDKRYHEDLQGCEPFITHVSYKVSRWRGLTRVRFSKEMTVADPDQFAALIPGFLHGAHLIWGEPTSLEVFPRPRHRDVDYWHVGVIWQKSWGAVYATYSAPQVLFPSGHEWHAAFELECAVHGLRQAYKPWLRGDSEPTLVARYFDGFPTPDHAPMVYLH